MQSRKALINVGRTTVDEVGSKRIVLTTKVPLLDGHNQVVGLVGISHDITRRKQIEESLANERNLLRTLIDTIPDFVFAKDLESRFILNNLANARSMNSTPEALLGKSDYDFFPAHLA